MFAHTMCTILYISHKGTIKYTKGVTRSHKSKDRNQWSNEKRTKWQTI